MSLGILEIPQAVLEAQGIDPEEWAAVHEREKKDIAALIRYWGRQARQVEDVLSICVVSQDLPLQALRWMSAVWHHRDQTRKSSGGPYSEHLWATAQNLVRYGFVEPDLVTVGVAHDVWEDVEAVSSGVQPMFFTEMGAAVHRGWDVAALQEEDEHLHHLVSAVSKPDIEDKELRSRVYLQQMMEALLEHGPKVILAKLADRLHNMETLDGHDNPDKQGRIAKETMDVFVPLARVLGLYDLQEALTKLCLKYLNPELLEEFESFVARREEAIKKDPFWQDLKGKVQRMHGVESVDIQPHKLVSLLDHVCGIEIPGGSGRLLLGAKPIEDVGMDDLLVEDWDPFVWVRVLTDSDRKLTPLAFEIMQSCPHQRWEYNPASFGFRRGVSLKTHGPDFAAFGGRALFRLNTKGNEILSKRGLFHDGDFELPAALRAELEQALQLVEEGKTIYEALYETVLHPKLRVSVFHEGQLHFVEMKAGATVEDLYCELYGKEMGADVCAYFQHSMMANPLLPTAQPKEPDSPLENGFTVLFRNI